MPFRRRRSRGRSGSRSVPSRKVWGGFHSVDVDGAPSPFQLDPGEFSSTWLLSPADAGEFYDEPTLARLLHTFFILADIGNADVANEWIVLFYQGIIVTDGEQDGQPGFFEPLDSSLQWVWQNSGVLWHRQSAAFAVSAFNAGGGDKGTLDIRTKRKIPEGYGLAYQVFNEDSVSNDFDGDSLPLTYSAAGRYLLLDH